MLIEWQFTCLETFLCVRTLGFHFYKQPFISVFPISSTLTFSDFAIALCSLLLAQPFEFLFN